MCAKRYALTRPSPLDAPASRTGCSGRWKPIRIAFLLSSIAFSSDASALAAFSRACRFDQIPKAVQPIAAGFFAVLGAPSWVLGLPTHSEKEKYWILESITTDYTSTKYYLGAKHTVYQWHQGNYSGWLKKLNRDSGLARDQLDSSVLADDKWKIFTNNRMLLFSARAGSADIVERTDKIRGANPAFNRWRVVGEHYYYDPKLKVQFPLPGTVAEDCNLKEGWPRP